MGRWEEAAGRGMPEFFTPSGCLWTGEHTFIIFKILTNVYILELGESFGFVFDFSKWLFIIKNGRESARAGASRLAVTLYTFMY